MIRKGDLLALKGYYVTLTQERYNIVMAFNDERSNCVDVMFNDGKTSCVIAACYDVVLAANDDALTQND